MRHRRKNIKFGIRAEYGRLMLRNLATSLLEHGRIETTDKKAKALKQFLDHTAGSMFRQNTPVQKARIADATLFTKAAQEKIMGIASGLKPGQSAVRTTKLRNRTGDNATVVLVELVTASS